MLSFLSLQILLIVALIFILIPIQVVTSRTTQKSTHHDQNVAILLSSSTFFHNYRHTTNALAFYQSLKTYGNYTDDNIILFLGDEVACNARNPYKNQVLYGDDSFDLYKDVQVDYSGTDVTVENFFRVLVGRYHPFTPLHQRLPIDHQKQSQQERRQQQQQQPQQQRENVKTNLLIYITGHGGDNFFKFRDDEDFSTQDLQNILQQAQIMDRFHSILFIADTCQAFTLAPNQNDNSSDGDGSCLLKNVYSVGTSLKGQSSYAHHGDPTIGHSVIDRFMFHFLDYMGGLPALTTHRDDEDDSRWSQMNDMNLKEALVDSMYIQHQGQTVHKKLGVDMGYSDFGCDTPMDHVPMSDFFVMKQQTQFNHDSSDAKLIIDQVDFWR